MPYTQNRRVTRPFCARALQQASRMTLDAAPSLAPSRQPALCWRHFRHFRHFQACAPLLARSMLQASQSSWLIHRENAVTALKEEAIPTGRLAPIDPRHFIFMIWATTQHYADFEVQSRALLGSRVDRPDYFNRARTTLEQIFLKGLTP